MTTSTVNDELAIDPIQVGRNADVVPGGTGIGVDAIVDHRSAVGIGRDAQSLGNNATAIGTETRAPANWNTVIGYQAGSRRNGENVVAIGRKAEVEGNNGVAIGESARANAPDTAAIGRTAAALEADATAVGRNARATASGAVALGQGTVNDTPDSVGIGQRDYRVESEQSLTFPEGTPRETLVEKPVTGTQPAGDPVGYTLDVGGETVAEVSAESDGSGGVQNLSLDVPVDLNVDGQTTEVNNTVTGDILIEDTSQTEQFRVDATASPTVVAFNDNDVTGFGVGDDEPISVGEGGAAIRLDSSSDELRVQDESTTADVLGLDPATGDLSVAGNISEGVTL